MTLDPGDAFLYDSRLLQAGSRSRAAVLGVVGPWAPSFARLLHRTAANRRYDRNLVA